MESALAIQDARAPRRRTRELECALHGLVKLLDTFSVLERAFKFQATDASALSNIKLHVVLSQPTILLLARIRRD